MKGITRYINLQTKISICRLFPFPGAKRNPEARAQWIRAFNRADPKKPDKFLEPSKDQVVCSDHFKDGKPTNENPVPVTSTKWKAEVSESAGSRKRWWRRTQSSSPIEDLDDLPSEIEVHPEDEPAVKKVSTTTRVILFLLLGVIRKLKQENSKLQRECKSLKEQAENSKKKKSS